MPVAPIQIGIDENGLGPRLGPMIVTGVRVEVDTARIETSRRLLSVAKRAGVGDSKAECAHGEMGDAEALVLAILETHLGLVPATFAALIEALGLDAEHALRTDCPDGEAPNACWREPVALPTFGAGPEASHRKRARALRDAGVSLAAARVGKVCAKRMNLGRATGRSRFDLDLAMMVRLASALRAPGITDGALVLCGKVGGRNQYAAALETLAPLIGVLGEKRDRSSYRVPGLGEVHFVMDGDASEPSISLASMIGKYVRELWMERIARYWIDAVPDAPRVSGYHEPQTERFVAMTALARKSRGIPDECFER